MVMNKQIYVNIIKAIMFVSMSIFFLAGVLKLFNYKDMGGGGGWQRFYQAKEDSIDVLFFGNSHAHCTIDQGLLWDKYGIAGYTLSSGGQQIDSTCYFVKEALKSQRPKVIVVEVMGALGEELSNSNADVYRNSLGMRWSSEFVEYVDYLADGMHMSREEKWDVFLKIPVIHFRYAELIQDDFEDDIPFMRGYRGSYERVSFEKPAVVPDGQSVALNSQKSAMLQEIIDVTKEKNIPLVLFSAPFVATEENQMQLNALKLFAEQQGVPFLNYNKWYDELSIDFETDFRDVDHVNNYGAAKVTEHFAGYLKDNYEIPDRRGDSNYGLWEDNALYLRNKMLANELKKAKDINEYLQMLANINEEQIIIIALTGNYNALGEVYLDKIMQLGITKEEYLGGVFLLLEGRKEFFIFQEKSIIIVWI